MTLFVHETHHVRGRAEEDFEAAFRDQWMPALASDGDARLLWYCHHAHGSGPAYNVVTVTGVRDGAAWDRLARRVQDGDLAAWAAGVDEMRHSLAAKVLVPVPWSPLQEVDLASVPAAPADHELSLYMEDTGWPHDNRLDAYVDLAGRAYAPLLHQSGFLRMEASFRPAYGTHRRAEMVLMQKILDHDNLTRLLTTEVPPERRAKGTWMNDALDVRDKWESKLLRTTSWSPWW
ncbi:MAG: hypothetical protein JO050_07475 [Acidimicrobiia bacterium]|nr:hypothetical protein [Acidimicrobiia bacterium]